jgi:polyferredoxin
MVKINTLRRTVQIISFLLIVYIGVVGIRKIFPGLPEKSTATGYTEILDTYGPVKTCRYISGDVRIFEGCPLYFLSKSISFLTPLKFILPHLIVFLVLAFLFGRMWCGWVCPVGFISEMLAIVRKNLGIDHINLSTKIRETLKKFRIFYFSLIVLVSLAIAGPFFGLMAYKKELLVVGCQTCPARILIPFFGNLKPVFYSFDTPLITSISIIGMLLLGLYLTGFFVRRTWCRICPTGYILSLFNKGALITKEKDLDKCTKCGICKRICYLQNDEVYEEKENENINFSDCLQCFRCIEKCPEPDCLKIKFLGKTIFSSGSEFKNKDIKSKND